MISYRYVKHEREVRELTSVREETIWSLGRLRAFASTGGEIRANRDMLVDVGNETEVGLNCRREETLGDEEEEEEEEEGERLGVAEARMANSIAINATSSSPSEQDHRGFFFFLVDHRGLCDEK